MQILRIAWVTLDRADKFPLIEATKTALVIHKTKS